jgi:hypothetical protein
VAVVVAIGSRLGDWTIFFSQYFVDHLFFVERLFMRMLANSWMTLLGRGAVATAIVVAIGTGLRAEEPGFKALFDGKTTQGWQGDVGGYEVKDGELHCRKGAGGKLLT